MRLRSAAINVAFQRWSDCGLTDAWNASLLAGIHRDVCVHQVNLGCDSWMCVQTPPNRQFLLLFLTIFPLGYF